MQKVNVTPDEGNVVLWLKDETDNIFTGGNIENKFLAMDIDIDSIYLYTENNYEIEIELVLISDNEKENIARLDSYIEIGQFDLNITTENKIFVGWMEEPEPYGIFDLLNLKGEFNVKIYSNRENDPTAFVLIYSKL